VPFKELDKITVCQPKELSLSTGDRLQLKANAQSQPRSRLKRSSRRFKSLKPSGAKLNFSKHKFRKRVEA
jgi:hypothetical protein